MAKWTQEEIALLLEYFPTEGVKCYKRFKRKSPSDIRCKAKYLQLYSDDLISCTTWKSYEDDIIREYYLSEPEKAFQLLKGRTELSIRRRAQELGVYRINFKKWTADQISYIQNHTVQESMKYTGKSRTAIYNKLRYVGHNHSSRKSSVYIDDRSYLRYGTDLQVLYTNLSPYSVKAIIATRINTSADIPEKYYEFIERWYPVYGNWVALYIKDVTVFSIIRYVREHSVLQKFRAWYSYEDDVIREFLFKEGRGITNRLPKRTYEQCLARYYFLGESSIHTNKPWAEYEDAILYEFYNKEGLDVCKRLDNRSRIAIRKRIKRLGIDK